MLKLIWSKKSIVLFLSAAIIFSCFASFYASNKKRQKILLVGLDGASWKIILPLIKEGKLPNIKRLMDNGCWGKLVTLKSCKSEIIWTTIATGKPPYLHGIDNSLVKDPDTDEMVPPTTNLRKVKAIWNILSDYHKKVGVVGYRVSWPAEKVNGVMVSDRMAPNRYLSPGYSEPSFVNLFGRKLFNDFTEAGKDPVFLVGGNNVLFKDIFMSNCSRYLLKKQDFDFFCLYLEGIDTLSHHYWKYMFPEGQDVSAEDVSKYKDIIKDCYIWCDAVIGDLLKMIDKDTTVIIASDHGFTKTYLIENYYIFSKIDKLLEAVGLKKFDYNSKKVVLENTKDSVWSYMKNIKITGQLSKTEFNAVRDNIKNILNNIKVEETGEYIFKIANYTSFGFVLEMDNHYINYNRDNHIILNGQEYKISDFLVRSPSSGDHDPDDAVIIISGGNIRRDRHLQYASVYDILPTVLYLLDLPVAKDLQGKILVSAITRPWLYLNPAKRITTYEKDEKLFQPQRPIRSPINEKILKDKMRSLGYIN